MPDIARRKWYVAALVLISGALVAEFVSKSHVSRFLSISRVASARARAEGVPVERSTMPGLVAWHRRMSWIWERFGFGCVVLSLVASLVARCRRETGPSYLLPSLLVGYVISALMLI